MKTNTNIKPGYKQTKLGIIPEDWEIFKFKEIASVDSNSLNTNTNENYTFRYVSLSDVSNGKINDEIDEIKFIDSPSRARRIVSKNSILLATVRPNLKSFAIVKNDFKDLIASTGYAVLDTKNNCKSDFLYQFLFSNAISKQFYNLVVGSNYPAINSSDVKNLKIPLPPLPEQEKIATILSTWDSSIEKTQKLLEKLKVRKKGLMQELLSGKKRLKGFSGEWEKVKLGDLAEHYSTKNKEDKEIEVLSCTKYDGLVRSLDYFGRQVYGNDLSKYKIVPNKYFAYATNHIEEGSIGYQDFLSEGLVSPMYTVFKTNSKIDDYYLFRVLKSERMIYNYQSNMSGSIARRGGLRWNAFETLTINLPKIDEQKAIENILNKADEEIKHYQNYLEKLEAQKKGLMQVLLTGELRVEC